MKSTISAILFTVLISSAFGDVQRVSVLPNATKPFDFLIVYEPRDSDVYKVMFVLSKSESIKDFFGMRLLVGDDLTRYEGLLLSIPLEQHWTEIVKEGDYSTEFLIHKDLFQKATIVLRCGNPLQERAYYIKLSNFASNHETEQQQRAASPE